MRIAILDDNKKQAFDYATALSDFIFDIEGIDYTPDAITKETEIKEFIFEGYDLLIIDQNLFSSTLAKDDEISDGEKLAKTFIDSGFKGKIVIFTGDNTLIEQRKSPTFFMRLFGNIPIDGLEYLSKSSIDDTKRLKEIVSEIAKNS